MDPFWGITLSVLVVSRFWKRERIRAKDRKYEREKQAERLEQAKQDEVIAKYSAVFATPMTQEEKEADKAAKDAARQRERDIAELRKQGYTDELIATIIPTINNGQ